LPENIKVYDIYCRAFSHIEKLDIFETMRLVGIQEEDYLFCIDLVNAARNEFLKSKATK